VAAAQNPHNEKKMINYKMYVFIDMRRLLKREKEGS
jgi:hypothetical protein